MDPVAEVLAFFARLPMIIEVQKAVFNRAQGSLGVIVEGAGSWTITFGDAAAETALLEEVDVEADCLAVWTVAGFAGLLQGEVNAPNAIIGDEKLLQKLGALLQPAARGGLGARLACF